MGKCESEGCEKQCCFNVVGEKFGRFCSTHKTEDMVNVKDKLCEHLGCSKRAGFNFPGEAGRKFCIDHRYEGMVNMVVKRCRHSGCYNFPIYNDVGSNSGKFCSNHKIDGMVNVVSKKCAHEGCDFISQFNTPGNKKGLYCSIHKLEGMVDVKHKKCEHEGCDSAPAFRFPNETTIRFCAKHKVDGMVDVKHYSCVYENCEKQATYNIAGGVPAYCLEHKAEGMVDMKHKMCEREGCDKRPLFNTEGSKSGRFCVSHKLDGMVDVMSKRCKSEWCNSYHYRNGYCLFCLVNLFPDTPISKNHKTKEKSVVDFVIEHFSNFTWIADRRVQDGCSRRRPDLLCDMGSHVIIVEVDENQHSEYDCSCENKRLMEISKDVGHRNIVFIRFNPDKYVDKNGSLVKSCWSANRYGIMQISSTNKLSWDSRLNSLKLQIEYWLKNPSSKMIEVVQLYYDNF
jgi:hypothetical protein